MATNFSVKISKLAYSPSFVTLASQNGLEYRNCDFKTFTAMIWLRCLKIWWT